MWIRTGLDAASEQAIRIWARVRKTMLILLGAVVLLMLLIVVLQSGLGVDSDETITDSHRPEIVGGD